MSPRPNATMSTSAFAAGSSTRVIPTMAVRAGTPVAERALESALTRDPRLATTAIWSKGIPSP